MTAPIAKTSSFGDAKVGRLGKGLSAIFADTEPSAPNPSDKVRTLPIEQLAPNPHQPRKYFDKELLKELSESIKEKGLLQPILVRPHGTRSNAYEIVAGERRWRASQLAGIHEVPVIVRDLKDKEALEIALIENIQRSDLSPLEEAETFQRLIDEYKHSTEELAEALGKSRAHIANTLRLNALPDNVKELVKLGHLTAGHARALLTAKDPYGLANEVVKGGLSVRQTEELARNASGKEKQEKGGSRIKAKSGSSSGAVRKDADVLKLEKEVSTWLGLKVNLTPHGKGGTLTIDYQSLEQLEDVLARLSRPVKGA